MYGKGVYMMVFASKANEQTHETGISHVGKK